MKFKSVGWGFITREAFLILVFGYVIIFGGGFAALVSFRLQTLSTVMTTLVLGAWMVIRLLHKDGFANSKLDKAIWLFVVAQFIAAFLSEDPRRSLPHAILWLVYILVFYFALDLFRKGLPQEIVFRCLLYIGSFLVVIAFIDLLQLFLQWKLLTTGLEFIPSFQQRLNTVVGDPNLFAGIINLLIPIALARLFLTKGKWSKAILVTYLILSAVILYFTDSRGGLLGLAGSVGAFILLWVLIVSEPSKEKVKHWIAWFWHRKVLLITMIILLAGVVGLVAWRFVSFEGSTTHAPVFDARDIYWQAATNAFKADPLTGVGPGIYPIYLMKIWSTPPESPYLHAHSFPFQVAAESGLLGLAALAFLIFTIALYARSAWSGLDFPKRAGWAAALAALVGFSIHSLVDDFFPFPAAGVIVMVLLATVMSPDPVRQQRQNLSPWWLVAPGLAAAVFTIYCLNAYSHADQAIALAAQDDWRAAALEMEMAAKADLGFALYWLQSGYAYGRWAEYDPVFLNQAIAAYEKGITVEPQYALSHANLAALLWKRGDLAEALGQMRIATSLAPESWLFWLNQGAYEEELGLPENAIKSYSAAIKLMPGITASAFWDETELRQEILEIQPTLEDQSTADIRDQVDDLVKEARDLIKISDFGKARAILEQAHSLNDQAISVYVALGELAFANDDLETAERYMQTTLVIVATRNQLKVEAILLGAEVSFANGDRVEAMNRYVTAFESIFAENSYGWGSFGWTPYAAFIFQRKAFLEDLLPQLERADITKEFATRLLPLADLYEEMGDSQKAEEVRLALQPYLP